MDLARLWIALTIRPIMWWMRGTIDKLANHSGKLSVALFVAFLGLTAVLSILSPRDISGDTFEGLVLVVGLLVVIGTHQLVRGYRSLGRRNTILMLPTSRALAVFEGVNEVRGRIECSGPITGKYSGLDVVYQSHEHLRSEGKRYRVVSSGTNSVRFAINDGTGIVECDLHHATVDAEQTASKRVRPIWGPWEQWNENALAVGESVLVIGTAKHDPVTGRARISDDGDAQTPFFATHRDHDEAHRKQRFNAWVSWLVSVVTLPLAVFFWFGTLGLGNPRVLAMGCLLALAGIILGVLVIAVYNVVQETVVRLDAAWSLIDVELQRRSDLIPALARVAVADRDWERAVLAAKRAVRTTALDERSDAELEKVGASLELEARVVADLGVIAEGHPELRSSATNAKLLDELTDCENRITFARQYYNDAIEIMQNRASTVPGRIAARFIDIPSATFIGVRIPST